MCGFLPNLREVEAEFPTGLSFSSPPRPPHVGSPTTADCMAVEASRDGSLSVGRQGCVQASAVRVSQGGLPGCSSRVRCEGDTAALHPLTIFFLVLLFSLFIVLPHGSNQKVYVLGKDLPFRKLAYWIVCDKTHFWGEVKTANHFTLKLF